MVVEVDHFSSSLGLWRNTTYNVRTCSPLSRSLADIQFLVYDPDLPQSPKLFSAHLLYRALLNIPSLISSWWGNIKDRQLLGAISSFITKHYSPVLISEELRIVKDPSSASELSGENWTIKVSINLGEVIASYTVDDQDMEIAIRLPPDYPLHSIEIREIQKVGVEEKRWRGWLLAVQQTITSQVCLTPL